MTFTDCGCERWNPSGGLQHERKSQELRGLQVLRVASYQRRLDMLQGPQAAVLQAAGKPDAHGMAWGLGMEKALQ